MPWVYDSHIHLSDPEYGPYMQGILRTLEGSQIKACCVSMDAKSSRDTLDLAKKSSNILPFIGMHPELAHGDLELVQRMIHENCQAISGIGEIGLDPGYAGYADRQDVVFESLLQLASKYRKPVSIHSRKSLDRVLDMMASYDVGHALLHWFDGNKKQLRRAMDMGFYVSYGPLLVYANDKQALLSRTDPSRLLVETDGPVRFSRCFGGMPAQPGFVPSVVFCAAGILGKTYDETALMLEANSESYLGI